MAVADRCSVYWMAVGDVHAVMTKVFVFEAVVVAHGVELLYAGVVAVDDDGDYFGPFGEDGGIDVD